MRKSTKLILAAAMLCFAIMAVNSNCVFADEQHDLIEKKVKHTNWLRDMDSRWQTLPVNWE